MEKNRKKKILYFVFICSMVLLFPTGVLAHPGRKNANGCHYCRTNCAQWGLGNNEYHCHYEPYTNSTFNRGSTNQITVSNETPKSGDNTLKTISVDGKLLTISNAMTHRTKKEKVEILVETNDRKATYTVDNPILKIGDNQINIKVIAENGAEKNYTLWVKREKLSNNANINITVNDQTIELKDGKGHMNVSSATEKLNYKYTLEDRNAKVKINETPKLTYGENVITFKVVAEDGTKKEYQLIVHKKTRTEEIISAILSFVLLIGLGYGIYYFCKMKKKK